MAGRDLDVVVFGATGFVGRLTVEHLVKHAPESARIGLAGRSESKLQRVRDDLGDRAADWPVIVADVNEPASLRQMAERTTVVATTVGPYVNYGLPLVAACAAAGTHYTDLTGEVLFIRRAIDAHHDEAARTGARIVVACGFDAVPSDLGVLELHRAAVAQGAGDLAQTRMLVTDLRGGVSGGTLASMEIQMEQMRRDAAVRRLVADPYALSPDRAAEPDRTHPDWGSERDPVSISRDSESGRWLAPFVMATFNTRLVRRSNALSGFAYGKGFRYREFLALGRGVPGLGLAVGATAATAAIAGALAFDPTRALLKRRLPSPGEGPSEQVRNRGRFRCEWHATTSEGARMIAAIAASGDPGYAATAVMFGEAALALALDSDLPDAAGVLTPATAIGPALSARLRLCDFTISAGVAP